MTQPDRYKIRRLLNIIIDTEPRCLYKPDEYLVDNASTEWATYICQDCPVLQQCRDYGDLTERWVKNDAYLGAVYGGETPTQRSSRRQTMLETRYAAHHRTT